MSMLRQSGTRTGQMRLAGTVHYVDGNRLLGSHGATAVASTDGGLTWGHLFTLPGSAVGRFSSRLGLWRRLLRSGVHHLLPVADDRYVAFAHRSIVAVHAAGPRPTFSVSPVAGSRPLKVCAAPDGTLYYGEYSNRPGGEQGAIFRSADHGSCWELCHRIPQVRHIHGVFHDPYGGGLWITTGDDDEESGIWCTTDGFATVDRLVGGNQQARCISLLFTADHIYFGSDTPLEGNFIYRMERESLLLERLQPVAGSVFHACRIGEYLVFSTAVEPSRVNRGREAQVWASADGTNWRLIRTYLKDPYPRRLFQYGQVFFPAGTGSSPVLWHTPFAVQDGRGSSTINLDEFFGEGGPPV